MRESNLDASDRSSGNLKRRTGRWSESAAGLETDLAARLLAAVRADADVMHFAARVSVWMRWFVLLAAVVELGYRADLWFATDKEYLLLLVPLLAFNGFVHLRLRRGREVTWRWLLFLSGMDVTLLTISVAIGGEFHLFTYVTYYPALALFAVVFTSLGLCLAWTTVAALAYSIVCLTVSGIDYELGQEKALLARVLAMYAVVACVSLVARFERVRRQAATEREWELHRERVEVAQAIHDTAAQTAYMISLGIHKARRLAGDSNEELTSTLAATSSLSKAAMWELRRPIDEGHLFEGRELGWTLRSHTETFEMVSSLRAEMVQTGDEPPLSVETRSRLFSIAHNALTNAFLHAQASKVEVRLDFEEDGLRLSVTDDGIGLPDDYADRGRGFRGMREDARRLGGSLIVGAGGAGVGTTVLATVPNR